MIIIDTFFCRMTQGDGQDVTGMRLTATRRGDGKFENHTAGGEMELDGENSLLDNWVLAFEFNTRMRSPDFSLPFHRIPKSRVF